MHLFSTVDRGTGLKARQSRALESGQSFYQAGGEGLAIADITNLRFETISRIIKGLERAHGLAALKIEGVHATRSFSVNFAPLAG